MQHTRFIILLCLAACTDVPEDELAPDDSAPVGDDVVFYETVIDVGPDGIPVESEPRAITAGEQRRQNEQRRAVEAGEIVATPYVSQDVGCGTASVWIYARTDFTGARICFRHFPTDYDARVYLGRYYRFATIGGVPQPVGDWRISSGSYWPGSNRGDIASFSYANAGNGTQSGPVWSVQWPSYGARAAFVKPSPADYVSLY